MINHDVLCYFGVLVHRPHHTSRVFTQRAHTEHPHTHTRASSAVEVGIMARKTLSLWSDLATHYFALRWHRVAVTRPKDGRNILPSVLCCQHQQIIKYAQP